MRRFLIRSLCRCLLLRLESAIEEALIPILTRHVLLSNLARKVENMLPNSICSDLAGQGLAVQVTAVLLAKQRCSEPPVFAISARQFRRR